MRSQYLQDREELIKRLMLVYPYSRKWFEGKSTAQLLAMLYKPAPKEKPAVVTITEKVVNGTVLHLTEAGLWEPEI